MKSIYKSWTIYFAVIKIGIGLVVVALGYQEVGVAIMLSALLDVKLRFKTNTGISL